MIREAKLQDLEQIVSLGIESLEVNDPYPTMRISEKRIRETTREVVSGASHFSWVYEIDGKIEGAVCALTHDIMFYERRQVSVLLYYCRFPSVGGLLIRKLVRWYEGRPGIKMLVFTLEHGTDPRVGAFLVKLGLQKELPTYVGVK